MAFCVEDKNPASACAGQTPRRMDFCAVDHAACREADFVQYCADAATSVTCLNGVLIRRVDCDLNSVSNGRCVETASVETHPCIYTAP